MLLLASIVCSGLMASASAQTLRMGSAGQPTLDPHFLLLDSNFAYNYHIFEALTGYAANGETEPRLAQSWEILNDTRWRFKLREGVKFHDGTPFTADDVIYSFERVGELPNNPAPYTGYVASIKSVHKVDDHTIEIETVRPNPLLARQLFGVAIVQKRTAENSTTADFNSGKAAIGTGPYTFVSHTPGERLVFKRNNDYWGDTGDWEQVEFRLMPTAPARMAALLAGEVDVIEGLSPNDAATLKSNAKVQVFTGPTLRVAHLAPNVKPPQGGESKFADVRIRQALSLAINRQALVDRILDGFGTVEGQIAAPGMVGYDASIKTPAYDPAQARKLLDEAGYKDDQAVQFHCPRGRYLNDVQICQGVAQMLAQAGFKVELEALPPNVYFSRMTPLANPSDIGLFAWSTSEGDTYRTMAPLMHSYDKDRGLGASNRAGIADAKLDKLIGDAGQNMDPKSREQQLREAMAYSMEQHYLIPLYAQNAIYAGTNDIKFDVGYAGWADKFQAMKVKPAGK